MAERCSIVDSRLWVHDDTWQRTVRPRRRRCSWRSDRARRHGEWRDLDSADEESATDFRAEKRRFRRQHRISTPPSAASRRHCSATLAFARDSSESQCMLKGPMQTGRMKWHLIGSSNSIWGGSPGLWHLSETENVREIMLIREEQDTWVDSFA